MTIVIYNIKRVFLNKKSIVLMLVLPISLMIMQVNSVSGDNRATVGVVWGESTELTETFKDCLESQYDVVALSEDTVSDDVINMHVDCAIVVPEGFTDDVINGRLPAIDLYILQESNISIPVKYYIGSFIEASNSLGSSCKGDKKLFFKGLAEYVTGKMRVEYEKFDSSAAEIDLASRSLGFLALGLMFFMGLSTTLILRDKEQNVYSRIMTTPVSPMQYTLANLASFAILGLLQLIVLFAVMIYYLNVKFGPYVWLVFAICYLFSISSMSIGILLSSMSRNMAQVNALTSLLNVPMLMLSGCFIPLEYMPPVIRAIAKFMPTNWFMVAVNDVMYGKDILDILPYILFLIGFIALLTIITFTYRKAKRT